jgi:deoxyribodipyrimidine photolyase-related protein
MPAIRHLCVILGDQLNRDSLLFDGFDPQQDRLWMAETLEEQRHVPSHRQRSLVFLSAMRHFAQQLHEEGLPLIYRHLAASPSSLAQLLQEDIQALQPARLRWVLPGDYRVLLQLGQCAKLAGIPVDVLADNHFIALPGEFQAWAQGRRSLRMEYWYRQLRKRTCVLMRDQQPLGEQWNFDADNRKAFGKQGPPQQPRHWQSAPDAITQAAMADLTRLCPEQPGQFAAEHWPVTRSQALQLLALFIDHGLALFGTYQDANWVGEPYLYHSRLSSALNLKLLHPMEVIRAAESAYHRGLAPLAACEGFIRQILGWREYVRGLYWQHMPHWLSWNALDAQRPLPDFYWTGDVDMACLKDAIGQVLRLGYGHHIQRLMITGLFAQLWQTQPQAVHQWYLAMYVDAVEWVELPNVLGMSQYADGGLMASKPYIASGRYIDKMSNYCKGCRYDPTQAQGPKACPYTSLYWAFVAKHQTLLAVNPRLAMQVRHWQKLGAEQQAGILASADAVIARYPASGHWPSKPAD